ncbi:uncharacterized protein LOC110031823 [Phalaenopsis equestris]|uniref:uncharacterized protein LOC110031823 n=1 Tax=Phalaenopsis equestris TaxID=78828 RepID=UPI0009E2E6C6|nr:uncharacterized protein LOC110031823 [Phalaenopsis equestris]
MLFAVEGGGFFSSSASGYSSGLSLLLLGHKNEERNVKVSPWNQYQLVHQDVGDDLKLSSLKNEVPHGCSSFTCFGCGSSCNDGSLHPKLDPFHHSESSAENPSNKAAITISVSSEQNERKVWLKSSLKKPSTNCCVLLSDNDVARNSMEEIQSNISCFTGRRKVQWSDTCGKELTEIREFELSDDGLSDDVLEHKYARRCECVIQ